VYVPSDVDQMLEQCCANAVCKHRPSLNMMHRDSLLALLALEELVSTSLHSGMWDLGVWLCGDRCADRCAAAACAGRRRRAARCTPTPVAARHAGHTVGGHGHGAAHYPLDRNLSHMATPSSIMRDI
jgi:hypothetical protein